VSVQAVARRAGLQRVIIAAALGALVGVFGTATLARAQEPASFPFGATVVLLPVQSVLPEAGGAWPGGAESVQAALDAMGAELAFAFGERRAAVHWAMPDAVSARAARNPMLGVDPRQVAFQGLLKPIEGQIYEPLHGQLRKLAALFGTRFVVLPLVLHVVPEPEDPARGRAALLIAMIDVRRSQVLWHGEVAGDVVSLDSPALLATLAARVASALAGSE